MLRAVLIDDDKISLSVLQNNLSPLNGLVEIAGAFTKPYDAVQAINNLAPDLVMLDIEMPEINGLELAKKLSAIRDNLALVFVTAHSEYALEAFRANAHDYLVKPCSTEDLKKVLLKIRKRLRPQAKATTPLVFKNEPFRIRTAGSLELFTDTNTEPIRLTAKITELLAYLLCQKKNKIRKRELQALFWAEQEPEKSMHSLYTAVYRLKRMLRKNNFPFDILSQQGYYQVALWDCRIDFEIVQQLAADNQPISASQREIFETVVNGYSSKFLFSHDYSWASDFADQIENDYRIIALRLLHYYIREQHESAFTLSERLERRFPYDDEIQTLILRLLSIRADETAVRQRYEKYRQRLRKECGMPPSVAFVRSYFELLGH